MADFFSRYGIILLCILGGMVLSLVVAAVTERKTRTRYFNHEKSDDDWSLFDDDEQ